jgi:hypothetical protein
MKVLCMGANPASRLLVGRSLIPARVAIAGLCLLCAASAAQAQETVEQERQRETIEPDRPDVTNGTHIVDTGLLQIEIGGLFTRASAQQHALGTPLTARIGVTNWLEARVGTDGILMQSDGSTQATGVGGTQIGAKLLLWTDPGGVPVLSILPTVNLPTASVEKGLGSGSVDVTVAMLTGTDLGGRSHMDINYGIGSIGGGEGARHFAQHLVSVSASAVVFKNWNPFIEAFWFSRLDAAGAGVAAIDAGVIYELGAKYALDGGVQVGVSHEAPALEAFAGLSMVVGSIAGNHGVHARQRRAQKGAARRGVGSATSR